MAREKVNLTFKNKEFEEYYHNVIRDRVKLLQYAKGGQLNRAKLFHKCKEDVVFFTNYFVITYNPRTTPSEIPFILFPEQIKMLNFFEECLDRELWGTVNKCRYTGASFISCVYILHALLFKEGLAISIASNKAELVDKRNNPNCLFEKVIMMYRWLPSWLKTFDLNMNRTTKLIKNPKSGTSLTGLSGDAIGRGGRSTIAFVDEAAHVEQDEAMISALSENTSTAILISTPKGKNNQFYLAAINDEHLHFTFRWEADPRRDEDWFALQKRKWGDEIAEQELNCNFNAGVEGQLIKSKWVDACVNAEIKITNQKTKYNDSTLVAGVDLGKTRDKTIVALRRGNKVLSVQVFPPDDLTKTALRVHDYVVEHNVDDVIFDANGFGSAFGGIIDEVRPNHSYRVIEYYSQSSPGDDYIEESGHKAKETYVNLRARGWWEIKERMRKTYDHIEGIYDIKQEYTFDDLIVLPDDKDLHVDFTKPILTYRGGKVLIESKEDMKKRGEASTDYADAVIMAFHMDSSFDFTLAYSRG